MKTLKIGLLGYGTVGQGVMALLRQNHYEWQKRTGYHIDVVAIAKRNWSDIEKPEGILCTSDANAVVNHPAIDVIVELMGGVDIAFQHVINAIEQGKHIVTANKALIAVKGQKIFAKAAHKGVQVSFEASVAGGLPIIKTLKEGLAANHIHSVAGIINGTNNYILTAMQNEGRDFDDVLAEAQRLGYAEADPYFDIEGIDAAHKICILSMIAFGVPVDFTELTIEGITAVDRQDFHYAKALGFRIKHLGIAIRRDNVIEIRVHPTLISHTSLMAKVDGVLNAIRINDNAVGETLYCGAGAGALPTAGAVMGDVLGLINHLSNGHISPIGHEQFNHQHLSLVDHLEQRSAHYLRLSATDKPGIMATIVSILAEHHIGIEALIRKPKASENNRTTIIIVTKIAKESALQVVIQQLQTLDDVADDIRRIRVEYFK